MKLSKTLTVTVAMLLLASLAAFAGEDKQVGQEEQFDKKEAPTELKNQTHCPVMGGVIDSSAYTDIQGQRVYHCCPGCTGALKKDPDKFFKKAATDGILFENIQMTCPVSGEKLEDKSVFVDYEGRRVAFCSKKCRETFDEEPAKFLAILDVPAEKVEGDEVKKEHEGHDH